MKDGEKNENTKKRSKKWIIAVVLIVIAAIAVAFYQGIFSLPTGLATAGGEKITENQNPNPSASSTPQQPTTIVTGKEMISTVTKENLPYYESADLEPGGYAIQVITDKPVWVNVYSESHFNDWKNKGNYGTAITGTGSRRAEYQTTGFSDRFYISSDGKGKYYVVIEGSGEVSINLKLVQTFKY